MTRRCRSIAAGLLLVLLHLPAGAAALTLGAEIRDARSGEALPWAILSLPDLTLGGVANVDGYVAVRGVPTGRHLVTASLVGYRTWSDSVDVGAEDIRIDIRMEPEAIGLEETVVTAEATTQAERERAVQSGFVSLPAAQLQTLPAVGEADLLRALQLLPGIQSASDVSSGLYVRGGGPDQTLILLDDVPLYNPSHAFGFFSTFQPDAVRDVQLYKGAYPAAYGGRLGAVLDVHQREGARDSLRAHGALSLISGRLLLEGPDGGGTWMVAGRRTYLDPLLAALRAGGADVPAYYFYDLNGKWTRPVSDRDRLTLSTYYGQDDLDLEGDENTFFGVRWGNRAVSARWTRLWTAALSGDVTVYASRYESQTTASFFDTPVELGNRIDDVTLRADLEFFATSHQTLGFGLSASRYDVRFAQTFNREPQQNLTRTPTLLEAYVQDDARLPTGTTVRAGLRAAWFSDGERTALMPRISISQPLTSQLRWKAGAGSYRQYLQLVATEGFSGGDFWVPLDDSVPKSRSRQWTTGLEWEPSRRYKVTVEAYRTDLRGLVVLDNTAPADRAGTTSDDLFISGGRGTATGLEWFAERRTGRLRGWIGYTLGRTRRQFDEIDGGVEFPPKYDRRHDVSVVASWRTGPWRLGGSFVYATGQAFTPASARYTLRDPATGVPEDRVLAATRNSARLLPYHRLDVSLRRQLQLFGARAEAYVQVFNLYSRRNEWFVQYDTDDPATEPEVVLQLPIVPTFGVEWSF